MDSTPQDLMVPDFPALAQAQDLMMPDLPAVAQAISGHLIAAPVNTDSMRNTMGDKLLAPPTASISFNRPPAAPDPIEWVTLLKSSEAVQPTSNLGNNVALHNPPPPSPMHDHDPGPTLNDEEMLSPAIQLPAHFYC